MKLVVGFCLFHSSIVEQIQCEQLSIKQIKEKEDDDADDQYDCDDDSNDDIMTMII